ncbi:MAG: TetR/AcrR family transcriptional regulator, partial [Pseudomonadota bacterium]
MSETAISASKPPAGRRPVGRPRGDGKPHLTREVVLSAAARLMAIHGYGGTSIRMIAKDLKASPASLFHLFEAKADLLNALIAYAAAPSLAFYAQINDLDVPADVALYKSVFEETRMVASFDREQAGLFYLPELRQPEFAVAQQVRADMVRHFHGLIIEGCTSGLMASAHPALAAEQVFQLTETSIMAGENVANLKADEQAVAAADLALHGLLLDPARLENIRQQAAQIVLT